MQGLAFRTSDLQSVTFPADLLTAMNVQIDVDLSHHQPKHSPRGMFLEFMLYAIE